MAHIDFFLQGLFLIGAMPSVPMSKDKPGIQRKTNKFHLRLMIQSAEFQFRFKLIVEH